jgi:type IV pilus assembly protein PilV
MKQQQSGATMIEVLVTMVIVVIGLMGMMSMQYVNVKNTNSSHFRYQAVLHAYDMVERMRANMAAVNAGNYNNINVDGSGTATNCEGSVCTTAALASFDAEEWGDNLATLPGGNGTVTGNGTTFTITVNWSEQHTGQNLATAAGGAENKSFVLAAQL